MPRIQEQIVLSEIFLEMRSGKFDDSTWTLLSVEKN